jgi:rhodanese-related sulfurtransferase
VKLRDYNLASARELLDEGGILLDVRTPEEYAELHVPGAVHVATGSGPGGSLDGLRAFLPTLYDLAGGDADKPIVVYCKLGKRAARAKRLLESEGYRRVVNLGGVDVEPLRSLIRKGQPLWRRTPPDLRPIYYQFFRDHPFVQSGDPAYQRLAWSIGLPTGAQAEQIGYELLGADIDVPGLGVYQPFRQRALLDFTRGMIQAGTGGAAFQPWQGFGEGAPQGFSAGFLGTMAAAYGYARSTGYGVGGSGYHDRRRAARRRLELAPRSADYVRPPRPFPPGPWLLPPRPAPRWAPGHPWATFAAQRYRRGDAPYAGRRGQDFAHAVPRSGWAYA